MTKKNMEFQTQIKIHFDEVDPAGIAFAGHIFNKTHRCYEEFIEAIGQNVREFFTGSSFIYPIRHIEVEYLKPLFALKIYQVVIMVKRISESSFQLQFNIREKGETVSKVHSTHVCCEKEKMKKAALPKNLKQRLEKYLI